MVFAPTNTVTELAFEKPGRWKRNGFKMKRGYFQFVTFKK